MEADTRTVPEGATWSAEICIVGAGPAGLALAEALRASGRSIVVLEGGQAGIPAEAQALPVSTSGGVDSQELHQARARGLGGTAGIWNTRFGGSAWAKYLPLDDMDFLPRDWVPWSGWPMTSDMLQPWYRRAYALCGMGGHERHVMSAARADPLHLGVFLLGPAAQFCITLPAALRLSTNVILVTGATATGLGRSAGGRVTEVRWSSDTGKRGTVHAEVFVLAAGGIENARFLLADRARKTRSWSTDDWLGRGFMEHPIDRSVRVRSRDPVLGLGEEFLAPQDVGGGGVVVGRIGLAPALLRAERLPNLSIRLGENQASHLVPPAALRSSLHRVIPSQRLRRMIGTAARRVLASGERWRGTEHRLLIDLEQWPDPDNRVVLTAQRDRHGQPGAMLHWRWREAEEGLRVRARAVVVREMKRAALGDIRVLADVPIDSHAHHHAGTTRMHADAGQGVVDADLLVHGEENLYVVGSSVFPTAGVANPTFTIVALSARLAEHLLVKT